MALARLDHEVAALPLANDTGDGATEMPVPKTIENDLSNPIERFTQLRAGGRAGIGLRKYFNHYAEALSYP
jgi:hypothetical protein